jgi:hypothetical protein
MLRSSSGSARSSLVSGGGVQKRAPGRAAAAGSRVSRILIPEPHKARARSCNGPCTSEDSELNCDLLMCCAGNGAAKKGQKSSSKDTSSHPWYGSDHLGVDDISNMLVQLPAMPMSASLQTCKFALQPTPAARCALNSAILHHATVPAVANKNCTGRKLMHLCGEVISTRPCNLAI